MEKAELKKALLKLDGHEIERQEILKKKGALAYETDARMSCFRQVSEQRPAPPISDNDQISHQEICIRKNGRFMKCYPHKHNYIELLYVFSGKVCNQINGKNVVVHEGEILMLDTNLSHSINPCGYEDIGINILMHRDFFDAQFIGHLSKNDIISKFIVNTIYFQSTENSYLHFRCGKNEAVQHSMRMILQEWLEKQIGYGTAIQGHLLIVFTELTRNHSLVLDQNVRQGLQQSLACELQTYLHEHYRTADLKSTAGFFNFNPDYFGRMIRQQFGMSFVSILQEVRLEKCCQLLQNSDLSLEQIAEAVGYSSASYLHRTFKKCHGQTPQEYRAAKSPQP